jgi:hypothetical protein
VEVVVAEPVAEDGVDDSIDPMAHGSAAAGQVKKIGYHYHFTGNFFFLKQLKSSF